MRSSLIAPVMLAVDALSRQATRAGFRWCVAGLTGALALEGLSTPGPG